MTVNIAEAKSKFSNLLAQVGIGKEEIVIAKRDKPLAVLLPYETFLKMKKQLSAKIDRDTIDTLSSSLEKYKGIVSENEIDTDYKESRESYLSGKYL